jgi:hypothetical protein
MSNDKGIRVGSCEGGQGCGCDRCALRAEEQRADKLEARLAAAEKVVEAVREAVHGGRRGAADALFCYDALRAKEEP